MSADNGVYILVTKDQHKSVSEYATMNTFEEGVVAYRVAYAQGIDALEWYENNQPYNVGYFLDHVFGRCVPVYTKDEALELAQTLHDSVKYTEYGICEVERLEYKFPGY